MVIVTKIPPHTKLSLAKKVEWQCCVTIVHNYLENYLLKLAFISVSFFYCVLDWISLKHIIMTVAFAQFTVFFSSNLWFHLRSVWWKAYLWSIQIALNQFLGVENWTIFPSWNRCYGSWFFIPALSVQGFIFHPLFCCLASCFHFWAA